MSETHQRHEGEQAIENGVKTKAEEEGIIHPLLFFLVQVKELDQELLEDSADFLIVSLIPVEDFRNGGKSDGLKLLPLLIDLAFSILLRIFILRDLELRF